MGGGEWPAHPRAARCPAARALRRVRRQPARPADLDAVHGSARRRPGGLVGPLAREVGNGVLNLETKSRRAAPVGVGGHLEPGRARDEVRQGPRAVPGGPEGRRWRASCSGPRRQVAAGDRLRRGPAATAPRLPRRCTTRSTTCSRADVRADFTQWHTLGVEWSPSSSSTRSTATRGRPSVRRPGRADGVRDPDAAGTCGDGPRHAGATTPRGDLQVDWVAAYARR